MDIAQIIGMAVATITTLAGGLWGWHKWSVSRDDQARHNINSAQDRTLEAHAARLDRHREQINRLDDLLQATRAETAREFVRNDQFDNLAKVMQATRDEIQASYVRLDHLEKIETQIREIEKSIDGKLDKIHIRVGSLARDLNQAIGKINQRHESEITNLVEQIKNAIAGK